MEKLGSEPSDRYGALSEASERTWVKLVYGYAVTQDLSAELFSTWLICPFEELEVPADGIIGSPFHVRTLARPNNGYPVGIRRMGLDALRSGHVHVNVSEQCVRDELR